MIQLLGSRGASAALASFMLALTPSHASAQTTAAFDVKAAVKAIEVDTSAKALGSTTAQSTSSATVQRTAATVTALYATKPAQSVTVALPAGPTAMLADGTRVAATPAQASSAATAIAREAAWLYRNGWPLYALVDRYSTGDMLDEQAHCMAVAIYHEARGEALEGQLAVARVIMNRAASGKYPASWCGTVKQPWQFSFVNPRTGQYPAVNTSSAAWRKAQAITRLAIANVVPSLSNDVLWYHADYVAPSWGRRLSFVQKIGTHIFYRS